MGIRDIMFRGKRLDNKEWVEGYYAQSGGPFIITDNGLTYGGFRVFEVDSPTVCQYIGKADRNGSRIFEGDILSAYLDDEHPEDITYVQVVWNGFSWCIRETDCDEPMIDSDCETFEVCGNIFDNPELMEGGES